MPASPSHDGRPRWGRTLVVLIAAVSGGCVSSSNDLLVSNEDFLDEDDVEGLAPGDANGSAFTGFYRLESFAVIDRYCARGNVNEVFGVLEPGVRGFEFAHVDGQASMVGWDQIPVPEPIYAGGVDADGDFGLGTIDPILTSEELEVGEAYYRVDGNIDAVGHLDSTWRQRVRYSVGTEAVDCEAVAHIEADFEAGAEGDPCTLDSDCPAIAPHCDGASCHDGSVGDPCANETDCVGALVCDGDPRTCR